MEFNPGPEGESAMKSAYSGARAAATKHNQAAMCLWQLDSTAKLPSAVSGPAIRKAAAVVVLEPHTFTAFDGDWRVILVVAHLGTGVP